MMLHKKECPGCGSCNIGIRMIHGLVNGILGIIGIRAGRCQDCGDRFRCFPVFYWNIHR